MKLESSARGGVSVLTPVGELTADSAGKFREAVAAGLTAGWRDFLVDLHQVTIIDSAGLEALTALQRQCDEQLGMVRFCRADATLGKIFEMTRLYR